MTRRTVIAILAVLAAVIPAAAAQATSGPVGADTGNINFGGAKVGSTTTAQIVTLTNNGDEAATISSVSVDGDNPGSFNAGDGCNGSVLAGSGGTCTFGIQFTPAAKGALSAVVNVHSPDATGTLPSINVSGSGLQGSLGATPNPVDFGNVPVGDANTRDVTVTNTGDADLTAVQAQAFGAGFSVSNNGCAGSPLSGGDHCTVTVRFAPLLAGDVPDGSLSVSADPGNGTTASTSVTLTGAGTVPGAAFDAPGSLSFATGKGGTSGPQTLTLRNTGLAPLHITSDTTAGDLGGTNPGQFDVTGSSCSAGNILPANGTCTVTVVYHPTSVAPADANVTVTTSVGDRTAPLSGVVLLPGISMTPTGASFGAQQDGTLSAGHAIVVKNTGQGALHVFGTAIVGVTPLNFSKGTDGCANHTLAQDETCTVFVRFSPKGRGARSAKLRVASDAGSADLAYSYTNLAGTSVAPASVLGLHGAVGCTRARLTWASVEAPRFLRVRIVRNALRIPRGPFDGSVREHSAGYLLDFGLAQLHTYHYAVYGVYSAWDSNRLIYSRANIRTLHTGRVCTPLNGSVIRDLTPFVDWTPYGTNPRYAIRLVRNGATILIRFPSISQYQIPLHWTYNGQNRALVRGGVYYLYVYAYTKTYPNGRWIGQTKFTEG